MRAAGAARVRPAGRRRARGCRQERCWRIGARSE